MKERSKALLVAAALLAGLAWHAYRGVLSAGFVYDDEVYIQTNPAIRSLTPVSKFLRADAQFPDAAHPGEVWRPASLFVYALDYKLGGLSPRPYHATSLLLHAIDAALVFLLVLALFGSDAAAFLTAAVFLLHPVQIESVAWASAMSNPLYLLFYLSSCLCFLGWKRRGSMPSLFGAAACAAAAFLSRETAASLPLTLALIELVERAPGETIRRKVFRVLPFAALAAAYVAARTYALGRLAQTGYWAGSLYAEMLTMLKGFALYVKLAAIPHPLSVEYLFAVKHSVDAEVILSGIVLSGLLLVGIRSAKNRSMLGLGVLLFFASLAPVSNIIPINALINERYLYLAVVGWGLVASAFLLRLRNERLGFSIAAILLAAYAFLDAERVPEWRDDRALSAATVKTCPQSARFHYRLAHDLAGQAQWSSAIAEYRTALALELGGRPSPEADAIARIDPFPPEVMASYGRSLQVRVDRRDALVNIGTAYLASGESRKAEAYLSEAKKLYPGDEWITNALALARQRSGATSRLLAAFPMMKSRLDASSRARFEVATLRGVSGVRFDSPGPRFFLSKRFGTMSIESGSARLDIFAEDASPVSFNKEDGALVYPAAFPKADVVYLAEGSGLEEMYWLAEPGANRFAHRIALGGGAKSLKLEGSRLTVLGESDRELLSLSAPLVFDSAGKGVPGRYDLAKEDAGTWRLTLSFDPSGLRYPVLIDPAWTTPNVSAMSTPRVEHTATLLPNGRVLVTGGCTSAACTTVLSTAEIYDPLKGTWSATAGTMNTPRTLHSATLLPSGKVLIAGGCGATACSPPLSTSELFDPVAGTFAFTPGNMTTAQQDHGAVLLKTGKVAIFGGVTTVSNAATTQLYDPVAGTWSASGAMFLGQTNFGYAMMNNGKILVAGGTNGGTSNVAQVYDPSLGTWSAVSSLPITMYAAIMIALPDGTVEISGEFSAGCGGHPTYVYDPGKNLWSAKGPTSSIRQYAGENLLPDGRVLITGGDDGGCGGGTLSTSQIYDPSLGTWSAAASMGAGVGTRIYHTSTLLPNGQVLIAGGEAVSGGGALSTAFLYDPAPMPWVATGPLGTSREAAAAVMLPSGKVLIAGGRNTGTSTNLSTAEIYDPATGTYSPTAGNMSVGRLQATATLLANGKVLVAGGQDNAGGVQSTVDLFDPVAGTFSPTGSMSTPRNDQGAALLPDGKVLIVGGSNLSGNLSTAELYDPNAGVFLPTGPMSVARNDPTATLLTNGRVLIAGGQTAPAAYPASTELYNPLTGVFALTTGGLAQPRVMAPAVLLPNGKVLMAGGQNGVATTMTDAELYDPVLNTWSATSAIAQPRNGAFGVLLPNGKVLIGGGCNGGCGSVLSETEVFDPATGIWTIGPSMATPRYSVSAILLGNNNILLGGGDTCALAGGCSTTASELLPYTEYDVFTATAARPAIANINGFPLLPPQTLGPGNTYTVAGATFTGAGEGSPGSDNDSSSGGNLPRALLMATGGTNGMSASGRTNGSFLDLTPSIYGAAEQTNFVGMASSKTTQISIPGGQACGYYNLLIQSNAVPSTATVVRVAPPPPASPASALTTNASYRQVSLGWSPDLIDPVVSGYVAKITYSGVGVSTAFTTPPGSLALTMPSLSTNTFYTVSLTPENCGGIGTATIATTFQTKADPAFCQTAINVRQDGTADTTTIQGAVNMLPPTLTGPTCIIIGDAQTYVESVAVQNIVTNNFPLIISGDPTFVTSGPVISPPAGPAFTINNASVTLANLTVAMTNPTAFGVFVSSPYVTLSSVSVLDPLSALGVAGIRMSTFTTVAYSSVSISIVRALELDGSGAAVVYSTMTSGNLPAVFINGSSSAAFVSDYIQTLGGTAMLIQQGFGNYVGSTTIWGSTGAVVAGSYGTTIFGSTLTTTNVTRSALGVTAGPIYPGGTLFLAADVFNAMGGNRKAIIIEGASGTSIVATGPLNIRGDVMLEANVMFAGNFNHALGGDLYLPTSSNWIPQGSTLTFDGSNDVPPITYQRVVATGTVAYNGFVVNVSSVQLFGPSNMTVFTDSFAGSTVTFPTTPLPTSFQDFEIHGGAPPTGFVNLRSVNPGTQWNMNLVTASSVTVCSVSDSNAGPGIAVQANDNTSIGLFSNNTNWNFLPILAVTLPGQVYTPGTGNVGAISPQTAGVPFTVNVYAVSSSSQIVSSLAFPVVLNSTDVYGAPSISSGQVHSLSAGVGTFSVNLKTAEPAPHPTLLTASPTLALTAFGQGFGVVNVNPNAFSQLQVVMPGEIIAPGSPSGKLAGFPPDVQLKAAPISNVLVRSVDQFFNLKTGPVDPIAITNESASSATWPSGPVALSAGLASFVSTVTVYSTGTFSTITAHDNLGAVPDGLSTPFLTQLPTNSSPTATLSVANSYVATLNGGLSGGSNDSTSVNKVLVGIQDQLTGFYLSRWPAAGSVFASPNVVFGTATLSNQGLPSTSWSIAVPDSLLTNNRTYIVSMAPIDASGNTKVYAASFTFNSSVLAPPPAGQGAAAVGPSISSGCEPVIATVTFTVGAAGIQPGGAVALRLPQGWTIPLGVSALNPPPPGYFYLASASPALPNAAAGGKIQVNPFNFGSVPLGPGSILVGANSVAFNPGDTVLFTYNGTPPLGPSGRGPQVFNIMSQANGSGQLAGIPSPPAMTLNPGTTNLITFTDFTPLQLGVLQNSTTMQLEMVDVCGNPTGLPVSTAAFVFALNSSGGLDPGATFYAGAGGGQITSVNFAAGSAFSQPFYYQTSSFGLTSELIYATATFAGVVPNSAWISTAVRPAAVAFSSLQVTGVSIDTATPNPGQTSAAIVYSLPPQIATMRFNSNFPNVPWDLIISTDPLAFSNPVFHAGGQTAPNHPQSVSWNGLNTLANPPTFASPGVYYVRISLAGGVATNTSLSVNIPASPFIYGFAGAAGAGAVVRADGPGAGLGNTAIASATGYFLIYGLVNGMPYNVTVSTGLFLLGQGITLSTSAGGVVAGNGGTAIPGTLTLPPASFMFVSATIATPAPRDVAGVVAVHNASYTVTARGNLHFLAGFASSDNGAAVFGGAPSTWTILSLPPDLYTVDVNIPGVQVSTEILNVSVAPGGATSLPMVLSKKTNVYGWAVLPTTFTAGEPISISAQAWGAPRPTIFGSAFVPAATAVVPTSGTYALYGLDPGSWTITAQAPNLGSTSTVILVSTSAADIGDPMYITTGLNLPLNVGGVIYGTVTVLGNTVNAISQNCLGGQKQVYIQAFNLQTGANSNVNVCLAQNAVSASSTFTLSGLDSGSYLLTTPFQIGFHQQSPAGVLVAVTTPTVATTTFTMVPNNALLAITIQIPPLPGGVCHSTIDYQEVGMTLPMIGLGSELDSNITQKTPVVVTPNFNIDPIFNGTQAYYCSSMTYTLPPVQTGPVQLAAFYNPTGAGASQTVNVVPGTTTPVNFNLNIATFTVSGQATLAGTVAMSGIPGAGAFTVGVSSIPGILAYAANVNYCTLASTQAATISAMHMELVPLNPGLGTAPPLLQLIGGSFCFVTMPFNSQGGPYAGAAYLAPIRPDGSFQFSGVPAGDYVLRNDPVLDGIASNGQELANFSTVVHVASNTAGISVPLSRGSSISGLVTLPSGMNLSQPVTLTLQDAHGNVVSTSRSGFGNSNTTQFQFANIADGQYSILAQSPNLGARPIEVVIAGRSIVGINVALQQTGIIRATIGYSKLLPNGVRQLVVINNNSQNLLPLNMYMDATANPWFLGGFFFADNQSCHFGLCGGSYPQLGLMLDANGQAVIRNVLPGTYNVEFNFGALDNNNSSLGLVPTVKSGVVVAPGQVVDLGLVIIQGGATLSGNVTDVTNSTPVANITMMARPSALLPGQSSARGAYPTALSDVNGHYAFTNLDPTVRFYDIFAAARQPTHPGESGSPYDMSVAPSVDIQSTTTLNFALTPAPYTLSGRVLSVNGELLFNGNGQDQGSSPGAAVFLQKAGKVPTLTPVADITAFSDPLGNFSIPNLTAGTYRMTVTALGYASQNLSVAISSSMGLGTIQMNWGATVMGTVQKPDGSSPSEDEIGSVIGAAPDMSDFFFGGVTRDPISRSVTGYRLSGFKMNKPYRLLFVSSDGQQLVSPPEAQYLIFTSSSQVQQLNIVFRPSKPFVVAKDRRAGGNFLLTFQFSQPLRERTAADDALTTILTTAAAQGALSNIALFDNRRTMTATYAPGVNESSFTLALAAYTSIVNPDSADPVNREFLLISTPAFYVGIDGAHKANVNNLSGGTLVVEGDQSRVTLPQGAFGVDASSAVNVLLQKFATITNTGGQQSTLGVAAANIRALPFQASAYPAHMIQAVAAVPQTVSPFSAFYDILLPLGLRTALSRPTPMTIAYSTNTDPTTLNLYWYNAAANAYILQQDVTGAPRVIDTVNHTITVNVNHFSTFVLFNTGVEVITGNAFAGGDIAAYNFPNPFDLNAKSVFAIHGGSCGAGGGCTVRGTMISIAVPPNVSGDGTIRIYNTAGERVRQIDLGNVNGGSYLYQEWDGRNNSGTDVASGVYIAYIKIGTNTKYFKMALVK